MSIKVGDEIQSVDEIEVVIKKKVIGRVYKVETHLDIEYAYFVSDDGLVKAIDIRKLEKYIGGNKND